MTQNAGHKKQHSYLLNQLIAALQQDAPIHPLDFSLMRRRTKCLAQEQRVVEEGGWSGAEFSPVQLGAGDSEKF